MASFSKRHKGTTRVGKLPADDFDLHDMHGNVWEWCEDIWHTNYDGAPSEGTPWLIGGRSNSRVLRVFWSGLDFPRECCSAYRSWNPPDYRDVSIGFRVACSPA